jgi:hypothetical protein
MDLNKPDLTNAEAMELAGYCRPKSLSSADPSCISFPTL